MSDDLETRVQLARTRHLLAAAPDLAAHILTLIAPGGAKGEQVRVSGSKDTPLPLNTGALEDANSLYAQLVNWTTSIARSTGTMPPATVLGWMRRDRDCDGLPSWAKPEDAAELVREVTAWLTMQCETLAPYPLTRMFFDDVHEIVHPLQKRYPMAPRTQVISRQTCPVCAELAVIVNFDEEQAPGAVVACTYCGHVIPIAAYARYLEEVLLQHAEESVEREAWTIDEAAKHAGVSRATVLRYIRDGLPVYGRPIGEWLRRDEFLAWRRRMLLNAGATRYRTA